MLPPTFTLRMTRSVSDFLLADLRALLPPESVQFFSNELEEEWHYTLLCLQNDSNCSLTVSAVLVWYQLNKISVISYGSAFLQILQKEISDCTSAELYPLLSQSGAVLYLS